MCSSRIYDELEPMKSSNEVDFVKKAKYFRIYSLLKCFSGSKNEKYLNDQIFMVELGMSESTFGLLWESILLS